MQSLSTKEMNLGWLAKKSKHRDGSLINRNHRILHNEVTIHASQPLRLHTKYDLWYIFKKTKNQKSTFTSLVRYQDVGSLNFNSLLEMGSLHICQKEYKKTATQGLKTVNTHGSMSLSFYASVGFIMS